MVQFFFLLAQSEEQIRKEANVQPMETRTMPPVSVGQEQSESAEAIDRQMFVDLLKGMLQLDAAKRLTPRQVLEHPFITMSHIASMATSSSYVQSCYKTMAVCQSPPDSQNLNAGGSSSIEGHSAQQSPRRPPTADHSDQQHVSPPPCNSTQSQRKSGRKRKGDGDTVDSHQSKMKKLEHSKSAPAGCSQATPTRTDRPANTRRQRASVDPAQSSQALARTKATLKRRLEDNGDRGPPPNSGERKRLCVASEASQS